MAITAVAFDLFGTLVFGNKLPGPYDTVQIGLNLDKETFRHRALTEDISLRDLAIDMLGAPLTTDQPKIITSAEQELAEDLSQIKVFDDTLRVLAEIKNAGIKIGIISNLARPYGAAALERLEGLDFDCIVFSYQAGLVKPQPDIYERFAELVKCDVGEILMVGDRQRNDLVAPRAAGMQSRLLNRTEVTRTEVTRTESLSTSPSDTISSLIELLDLIDVSPRPPILGREQEERRRHALEP